VPTDDRIVLFSLLPCASVDGRAVHRRRASSTTESNPGARAPGERRQPMRGAPPLSQGRRWGCSQHAHCVCICTAGRRMVVSSRAKTQQSRWGCGCTWSKCIGLSSERLAAADPCAFPPQCILLALFNFSRGVVGQPTTRLGGFFFFCIGLEGDDDTTFRSETRMPKPVQHWGAWDTRPTSGGDNNLHRKSGSLFHPRNAIRLTRPRYGPSKVRYVPRGMEPSPATK